MSGADDGEEHYLRKEFVERMKHDDAVLSFFEEHLLDGVWLWDLEKPEHEWMNAQFWRVLGVDPATKKHLASEWQDLIFEEDRDLALANFRAHIADPNHPYDQVVRYRHASGGTVWVRCRGVALRDENGVAKRLLGAHVEITDEVVLRDYQLGPTTKLLENVLNTATSGVVGLNARAEIVSINPAARHMLGGLSDEPPLAWPPGVRFLHREDLHPLDNSADPIARSLAGQDIGKETHLLTKANSDEKRYVRLSSGSIDDPASPVSVVVVMDDVTEQERSRQQNERSGRLDALGQLTGGIAHDFNNLLATVQYAARLIADRDIPESAREYLRIIDDSVERGSELTGRLLAFARQNDSTVKSHRVSELLEAFRLFVRPILQESIELSVSCDDESLYVYCNKAQLESSLLNLVINSRDAIMQAGVLGKIDVRARGVSELDIQDDFSKGEAIVALETAADDAASTYRFVDFSVSDNGPGMSDDVMARAVDPFFTTKAVNTGSGLGLSMVYGFVRQSEGALKIYSEPAQGTSIRMILPRGDDEGRRESPQSKPHLEMGSGQTILVAEDDPSLQIVVEDVIKSLNYSVTMVEDGDAALEVLAKGGECDLLLTDIVMPGGLGGFDLARRARALRPTMPIIYMSGYAGLTENDMGEVVAPRIRKPCQPEELAAALASELRKE